MGTHDTSSLGFRSLMLECVMNDNHTYGHNDVMPGFMPGFISNLVSIASTDYDYLTGLYEKSPATRVLLTTIAFIEDKWDKNNAKIIANNVSIVIRTIVESDMKIGFMGRMGYDRLDDPNYIQQEDFVDVIRALYDILDNNMTTTVNNRILTPAETIGLLTSDYNMITSIIRSDYSYNTIEGSDDIINHILAYKDFLDTAGLSFGQILNAHNDSMYISFDGIPSAGIRNAITAYNAINEIGGWPEDRRIKACDAFSRMLSGKMAENEYEFTDSVGADEVYDEPALFTDANIDALTIALSALNAMQSLPMVDDRLDDYYALICDPNAIEAYMDDCIVDKYPVEYMLEDLKMRIESGNLEYFKNNWL